MHSNVQCLKEILESCSFWITEEEERIEVEHGSDRGEAYQKDFEHLNRLYNLKQRTIDDLKRRYSIAKRAKQALEIAFETLKEKAMQARYFKDWKRYASKATQTERLVRDFETRMQELETIMEAA